MKAAIYARCAIADSDKIQEQVLHCREFADERVLTVDDTHMFVDSGMSGASVNDRPALQLMIEMARKWPPDFDCVLVYDTARIARNLTVLQRVIDECSTSGVLFCFVCQGLDSGEGN